MAINYESIAALTRFTSGYRHRLDNHLKMGVRLSKWNEFKITAHGHEYLTSPALCRGLSK
jgi:hypothetical protein